MASLVLSVICFTLIVYRIYKWMFFRPKNFPPGPPRIPLLGGYPFLLLVNYHHMHKAVDWLCAYYKTDVLGFYAGNFLGVIANSAPTVKEMLVNHDFDGKASILLARMRDPNFQPRGIFFTEGHLWHEQRKYMLRNLRQFGFGRRFDELELEINDELNGFITLLKDGPKYEHEKKFMQNGSVFLPNIFVAPFGNIFLKVILNERLPREKSHILFDAGEQAFVFLRKGDDFGRMFSYIEWLAKLFPNWSEYNVLRESFQKFYSSIKTIIDAQYETFDPNHERNFLDLYFKKIRATADDKESTFYYDQMILLCSDFFLAALVADSIAIQFLFQQLYFRPNIMRRCQEEIDQNIGNGRLPTLSDRTNLPYVEATIRESLRYDTIIPSGLPHRATADTKFMGYTIPEGTVVWPALNGCNMDTKTWQEPDKFKPERFLDENGEFDRKLDKSLPFGAGRRVCAGETFARQTMFLMTTTLLQNFNIAIPNGERMPDRIENKTGLGQSTPEFWLKFVPR